MKMNEKLKLLVLSALEARDFDVIIANSNREQGYTEYAVLVQRAISFYITLKTGSLRRRTEKQALKDWRENVEKLCDQYYQLFASDQYRVHVYELYKSTGYREPRGKDINRLEVMFSAENSNINFHWRYSIPADLLSDCDDYVDLKIPEAALA